MLDLGCQGELCPSAHPALRDAVQRHGLIPAAPASSSMGLVLHVRSSRENGAGAQEGILRAAKMQRVINADVVWGIKSFSPAGCCPWANQSPSWARTSLTRALGSQGRR